MLCSCQSFLLHELHTQVARAEENRGGWEVGTVEGEVGCASADELWSKAQLFLSPHMTRPLPAPSPWALPAAVITPHLHLLAQCSRVLTQMRQMLLCVFAALHLLQSTLLHLSRLF